MPGQGHQQKPGEGRSGFRDTGKQGAAVGCRPSCRCTPLGFAQEVISGDSCGSLTSGGQGLPMARVSGADLPTLVTAGDTGLSGTWQGDRAPARCLPCVQPITCGWVTGVHVSCVALHRQRTWQVKGEGHVLPTASHPQACPLEADGPRPPPNQLLWTPSGRSEGPFPRGVHY